MATARPELFMSRGLTLAAQSAMALGILTDKDVFYAAMEYSVQQLRDILSNLEETLQDELDAQGGYTRTTKVSVGQDDGESLDSLRTALSERETKQVYLKGRNRRLTALLTDLQTWYQLYTPGFLSSSVKRRHLDPVMDRLRERGSEELATSLQDALDAMDGWSAYVPFYEGSLQPARTTHAPSLVGKTGPFVIQAGSGDIELTGLTGSYTWSLPESSKPEMALYTTTTTFQSGAKPELKFDAGAPNFTTQTAGPITVTMDATIVASSPAAFATAVIGQYVKIGANYYGIINVLDGNTALLDGSPGAGVYPNCEIHNPHTFTITLVNMTQAYSVPTQFTIALPGGFGSFSPTDLRTAFQAALPPTMCTYAVGAQDLTITVENADDRAAIVLDGDPAGRYPLLYDSLNVVAGTEVYGQTDTSSVEFGFRDGAVFGAVSATLNGSLTPATIASQLAAAFAGSKVEVTFEAPTPEYVDGRVLFRCSDVGSHSFLINVRYDGFVQRAWGASSVPASPASPFQLFVPENPEVLGPYAVVLDGTMVVVIDEDLSATGVDTTWKVGITLEGSKHVAYYDADDVAFVAGQTVLTLPIAPFYNNYNANVRFTRRPITLRCLGTDAGVFLEVDSSAAATELGLAGKRSDGTTTDFVLPDGTKAGYYVYNSGEQYKVVTIHDDGSGTLGVPSPLPAETLSSVEIWSPGAESMTLYTVIDNWVPPFEVSADKQFVTDLSAKVAEMCALIDDTDRHEVLESAEFQAVLDFCASQKLELLESLLHNGCVEGFFSSERGSLKTSLTADGEKYSEHDAL